MHRRLLVLSRVAALRRRATGPPGSPGRRRSPLAKILENMEIGHNVMHGQWDWMNDPDIHSSTLGLGHGLDGRGVEALPQLRPPHVHEHPRQGQGSRLRDHADRPAPEVAPGLPGAAVLQPGADGVLRVGRRVPRPRPRGDQAGEKSKKQLLRELKGMARKARPQIAKDYIAFPALAPRRWRRRSRCGASSAQGLSRPATLYGTRRTSPRTSCATSGPTRSSSAATSPTRRTPSARRRSRTRRAAASTSASCSARRTSRAAPLFHVLSGNLGYQVEHHLYPDMPSTRYAEIAPRVKEICERYELPYNTRPVPASSSGWCSARSCASRSRAASRGRSPARTAATTETARRQRRRQRGEAGRQRRGPEQPYDGVRVDMPSAASRS